MNVEIFKHKLSNDNFFLFIPTFVYNMLLHVFKGCSKNQGGDDQGRHHVDRVPAGRGACQFLQDDHHQPGDPEIRHGLCN